MSDSFGNYLKKKFHEWSGKQIGRGNPIPSQADFAKFLGVPTTSLSVWMNDLRKPTGDSVDILAERLNDPEVYDYLGVSRRMPRSKELYNAVDIYSRLDEDGRREYMEAVKNIWQRRKGGDGGNIHQPA